MTLTQRDLHEVADELDAAVDEEIAMVYRPRFNVAPTDRHPVVRVCESARRLELGTWGLLRPGRPSAPVMINARAETVSARSMFREAFARRRCVIPADGFYEWSGEKEARRPFWIHRADGRLLYFSGLYDERPTPDGDPRPELRFTVLTTEPNGLIQPIHDRMPAILTTAEDAALWLREGPPALLRPAPEALLVATPVSRRVNSVKNDDPACLAPESAGQLSLTWEP